MYSFTSEGDISADRRLSIWDLQSLLFLLASVASKWKVVGFGLQFTESALKGIAQKLIKIVGRPDQYLQNVLTQWLRSGPPKYEPHTIGALARVLRLPTVNEERLAIELENTYQLKGSCTCLYTLPDIDDNIFYNVLVQCHQRPHGHLSLPILRIHTCKYIL